MLSFAVGDPVLVANPLNEPRLNESPQVVAELAVPEFTVVLNPSSKDGVVSTCQFFDAVAGRTLNFPAPNCPCHSAHGLAGCSRHTLAVNLPFKVLQGSHLKVVAEKGEGGGDISPLEGVDIDHLGFLFVDLQTHFTETSFESDEEVCGIAHPAAMANDIVGIPLKRNPPEFAGHPYIECIVEKQIRQQGRNDSPLWSADSSFLKSFTARRHHWRLQPSRAVEDYPPGHAMVFEGFNEVMPHIVKESTNVNFQNPTPIPASLRTLRQCLMSRFPGTIPIGIVVENRVETLLHVDLDRALSDAISHGWYTEDTFAAIIFGNAFLQHWRREIRSRA